MKIVDICMYLFEYKFEVVFESVLMWFDCCMYILVEVICDDGIVGWGECFGLVCLNVVIVDVYKFWLIG